MHPTISRTIFGATQKVSGANLFDRIDELNASQWLSRSDLADLQWRRLSELLKYAYENVPYYRSSWDEHGIKPGDIQSFDDLRSLPYLTKADIQDHFASLKSRSIKGMQLHHGRTSGSTSSPVQFVRTQDSKARFWAAQYRGYGWHGIHPGDRQGRFFGMPIRQINSTREKVKDFIMNRRRLGRFDLTADRMRAFALRMNRFKPVYLNGYASWLGRFAEFISEEGAGKYNWIPLKGVVSTSEVLTEHHKALIERAFGCQVINEYGSAEIGLVAISCPSGGFHTVPENVYLEQVPVADTLKSAGERLYEVVVTDLHSHAMPFIRYKVGDYLRAIEDEDQTCACGRSSGLIGSVLGRTNSYVITPAGDTVGGFVFDYVARTTIYGNGISSFAARQTSLRTIVVYMVKSGEPSEKAMAQFLDMLKRHLGPEIDVKVEFVEELPRTSTGKLNNFSSELDYEETLASLRREKRGVASVPALAVFDAPDSLVHFAGWCDKVIAQLPCFAIW